MSVKYQRQARKWAIRRLGELGVNLPVNASYADVAVEVMKRAKEVTGSKAVFGDGEGYDPKPLLAAFYFQADRSSRFG